MLLAGLAKKKNGGRQQPGSSDRAVCGRVWLVLDLLLQQVPAEQRRSRPLWSSQTIRGVPCHPRRRPCHRCGYVAGMRIFQSSSSTPRRQQNGKRELNPRRLHRPVRRRWVHRLHGHILLLRGHARAQREPRRCRLHPVPTRAGRSGGSTQEDHPHRRLRDRSSVFSLIRRE